MRVHRRAGARSPSRRDQLRQGRISPGRHDARGGRAAQAGVSQGRHRHRGELERDKRRGGGAARSRTVGQSDRRTETPGAYRLERRCRRRSELHGVGPHSGDAQGAETRRPNDRSDRSGGAERGLRRTGNRVHPRAHARPGARQHLRRRDRPRPPARRDRRAHPDDFGARLTPHAVALWSGDDVHRRGTGDRHDRGAGLMAAYDSVLIEIAGGVGTVTLNRPEKLNAFDGPMCRELTEALRMLAGSEVVRVIVVTGSGRAFCAGADLSVLGADGSSLVAAGKDVALTLRAAPQPVLAAVNGPAAGGGAHPAPPGGYRIAPDPAAIGQVFHKLGLVPDWGGSFFLPRLVGTSRALELVWSARMVPGGEALAKGLFDDLIPHARLP